MAVRMMVVVSAISAIVVVMAVIVAIIVMMMSVLMIVIVVVIVVMMVIVTVAGCRLVGAAFRLERRIDLDQPGTERLQQRLDRRIAAEPQPLVQDLHRDVAIAEVPGHPRQRRKVGAARLDQGLGLGHHLGHAALFEHQRIVGAKPHRFRQIELDAGALGAEQEALLRLALGERQDQRIDDRLVLAVGGRKNAGGARHEDHPAVRRRAPQLSRVGRSASSGVRSGGTDAGS